MIRVITKEVHYTISCSFIDIEDTFRTCLWGGGGGGVIGLRLCLFLRFFSLVCLFLRLFMCVMFRVSLVFMSASSVVSVCVYFYVSI